jgi:hypothetical protein
VGGGEACALSETDALDLQVAEVDNNVETFNNMDLAMATVNFSVPDEVKEKFNRVFKGRNKSQIIAELMVRAVEEEAILKKRAKAIESILSRRGRRPPISITAFRKAREEGRP